MKTISRKYYIDNLRWMILLILIPYHTAQAWNVWGEPNYIWFEGNRWISSIIVFFSPYFMPLLFVLAGISTKYALQKRTGREYLSERTKRLLLPFFGGVTMLVPIMSYLGDKFNYGYQGSFFAHYGVFFTKCTDFTGADGGFSLGQFWFLLYLYVISLLGVGVIMLLRKIPFEAKKPIPFWGILALGLPLPILSDWLSVAGKSLAEFWYLFLLGYYVFAKEETVCKVEKYKWQLLGVAGVASMLDVYLFIWAEKDWGLLNDIAKYLSEWIMVLALIGFAKRYLDFRGKVSDYMKSRSFLFYIYHFVWVVLFQYLLRESSTAVIFVGTLVAAYLMTFVCCEISIRMRRSNSGVYAEDELQDRLQDRRFL